MQIFQSIPCPICFKAGGGGIVLGYSRHGEEFFSCTECESTWSEYKSIFVDQYPKYLYEFFDQEVHIFDSSIKKINLFNGQLVLENDLVFMEKLKAFANDFSKSEAILEFEDINGLIGTLKAEKFIFSDKLLRVYVYPVNKWLICE
jgi:hypothetical protein